MGVLSIFPGIRRRIADPDLAIDLGTANTRMYAAGKGLLADEPSVVGISAETGFVEAIGSRAASLATNPDESFRSVFPLRAGVIEDLDAAAALLTPLFRRAKRFGLIRPRVLACAPTDACDEERAAIVEAASRAGAASVTIAPEPLAAAIGAGLDVSSPYAQMIVDVGDGVTDIAVICSGEVILASAVRTACSDLHTAVRRSIVDSHGAWLYMREAERLTRTVGVARGERPVREHTARGADCRTGRDTRITVSNREVSAAMDPIVDTIIGAVLRVVADLPSGTSCEVIESGVCLTGGGAALPGLAELLAKETQLDVKPAADPLRAVINGARQMLTVCNRTGLWMN